MYQHIKELVDLQDGRNDLVISQDPETEQCYAWCFHDGQIYNAKITPELYRQPGMICRCLQKKNVRCLFHEQEQSKQEMFDHVWGLYEDLNHIGVTKQEIDEIKSYDDLVELHAQKTKG